MIRRPPRSTLSSSSAASDVYKRQGVGNSHHYKSKTKQDHSPCKFHWSIGIDFFLVELKPQYTEKWSKDHDKNSIDALKPGRWYFPATNHALGVFFGKNGKGRSCLFETTPKENIKNGQH